jgi:hypothetical protein
MAFSRTIFGALFCTADFGSQLPANRFTCALCVTTIVDTQHARYLFWLLSLSEVTAMMRLLIISMMILYFDFNSTRHVGSLVVVPALVDSISSVLKASAAPYVLTPA